jgi:hypothetical protein
LYMRCREGHDPFTQFEKDPLSFHWFYRVMYSC